MSVTVSIKSTIVLVSRILQKAVVAAGLSCIYCIGVGVTMIVVRGIKPFFLRGADKKAPSNWKKAEGYEPSLNDCLKQS